MVVTFPWLSCYNQLLGCYMPAMVMYGCNNLKNNVSATLKVVSTKPIFYVSCLPPSNKTTAPLDGTLSRARNLAARRSLFSTQRLMGTFRVSRPIEKHGSDLYEILTIILFKKKKRTHCSLAMTIRGCGWYCG